MKKKILLLGYMRKNLGDDLFIAMLLNRYKDIEFVVRETSPKYSEPFKNYDNFKVVKAEGRLIDFDTKDFVACVYIGGSVLAETKNGLTTQKTINSFLENCKKNKVPFFYISSNFGPYKTKEFYDECEKTIKMIDGICFRDKYSYEEFNKYKSVNYAADVVFALDMPKKKTIKNSIGISVIDLALASRSEALQSFDKTYCEMLKRNIINFIDKGKDVYLFSYCEYEGDLLAIKKVKELLPIDYQNKVHVVEYTGKEGNLYDFIKKYSMMEKMICTRFHSLVLSLLFKQDLIVISYSKKLEKLLCDIPQKFKYIEMDKKLSKLVIDLNWFNHIDEDNLNVLVDSSYNQFSQLDKKLKLEVTSYKIKVNRLALKKRIKRKLRVIKNKIKKIIKK